MHWCVLHRCASGSCSSFQIRFSIFGRVLRCPATCQLEPTARTPSFRRPSRHNHRDISRVFWPKNLFPFLIKAGAKNPLDSFGSNQQRIRYSAQKAILRTLQQHQLESLRVIFIVTAYRALSPCSVPLPPF